MEMNQDTLEKMLGMNLKGMYYAFKTSEDMYKIILGGAGVYLFIHFFLNAGGVATSGLEMTQNAMHLSWPADEVDARLRQIMADIHDQCQRYGKESDGYINYMKGANVAGFMKVATAMLEQGVV